MTIVDLISTAHRMARIRLAAGRNFSQPYNTNATLLEGQARLNSLVDALRLEDLLVWAEPRHTFPLVANQPSYTIGYPADSPDFELALGPPVEIIDAGFMNANGMETPLRVFRSEQYRRLAEKSEIGSEPVGITYEPGTPMGTIRPFPIPSQVLTLVIYTQAVLPRFDSLTETIRLKDGYQRMLEFNLTLEIAAMSPRSDVLWTDRERAWVEKEALRSKAVVKNKNEALNAVTLKNDFRTRQHRTFRSYDVNTGTYR